MNARFASGEIVNCKFNVVSLSAIHYDVVNFKTGTQRIVQRGNPFFFMVFQKPQGRRDWNETHVSAAQHKTKEHARVQSSNEDEERKASARKQESERSLEALGE